MKLAQHFRNIKSFEAVFDGEVVKGRLKEGNLRPSTFVGDVLKLQEYKDLKKTSSTIYTTFWLVLETNEREVKLQRIEKQSFEEAKAKCVGYICVSSSGLTPKELEIEALKTCL